MLFSLITILAVHSVFYPEPVYAESGRTIIYNNTELYVSLDNRFLTCYTIFL